MLFKNTMRPAYATVGGSSYNNTDRSNIKQNIAFYEGQSADSDFGSFGSSGMSDTPRKASGKTRTSSSRPSRPARSSGGSSGFPVKPVLIAVVAVVAVVLLILIITALFSAPKNGIELEDNAYFVYSDNEGVYHAVANGKVINHAFEGKVTLTPSADNSFAYVFEEISNESASYTKGYILEGTSLKNLELKADQILELSPYGPGIIYKRGTKFWHYSESGHGQITELTSADNFVISGNGTVVIYTVDSIKSQGKTELRYFRNGSNKTIGPYGFIPVALSNDGKYIYGTNSVGILTYMEVKKDGEVILNSEDKEFTFITSSSYGYFAGISGMNVDGDEIIFHTEGEKGVVSYLYKLGSEPMQISEGMFEPIAVGNVVCPETFIGTYFKGTKEVTDANGITETKTMTFFLDKKDGAIRVADTVGKFSPEGDYFYYTDEYKDLIRVTLGGKDFAEKSKSIYGGVSDFVVIEKGDVYVMVPEVTVGIIAYIKSSTTQSSVISYDAKIDSMQVAANSIYFSELGEDGTVTVYSSTAGAAKESVSFKSVELTSTPIITMGAVEKGYALYTDENGVTKLYYTSNGEKFNLIADGCFANGYNSGANQGTEKPTEAPEDEEDE